METYTTQNVLDIDLARRADRKLRRFGSDLNRVLAVIVSVRGVPDFVAPAETPKPLDAADWRIGDALARATVRRVKPGLYRAETPAADDYWAEGATRAAALADLRDNLRYLISDPVAVEYTAYGRKFTAEARPAKEGGFWAVVPALDGASTQGDTMDELKYMLIDMTKLIIEEA